MTSTRWHRTRYPWWWGGPISVGRSFIRRRGSWDRRCSGVEGDIGNDSFHFQTESGFSAIHLFLSETPFRSSPPNLPPTFSCFFLLRSLDIRPFPAPKLPLPRDLVRVSLLSSLRRGVRGEARFGQPNLLNRWLGKRATDGERG